MVNMLGNKKCYVEQEAYAKESILTMYLAMSHVFESVTHTMSQSKKQYEKALAFYDAHERLLSIFDSGCADFQATYKIIACESKAQIYMKTGDKAKCLETLRRFFELADQVKSVSQSPDFSVSTRNPLYFSGIGKSIQEKFEEEYMSNIYPERALGKYDSFFGDDGDYLRFKEELGV